MRVSTKQLFTRSVDLMMKAQTDMARLRDQISTGQRILSPADDPAGSARILELDKTIAVTGQFQANINVAEGRLGQSESVLNNITNTVRRVRDLALAGSSGHLTDEDREFIALEVRQRLDELLVLANTQDSNGEYIFAGFTSDAQAFSVDPSGQVVYNGDQGQRFLQVGPGRLVADRDTGDELFMAIRNGNGTFVVDPDPANTGDGVIDPGTVIDAGVYQPDSFRIVFTGPATYDIINDTTATTIATAQPYVEGAVINFNGIETSITGTPLTGDEFDIGPAQNQSVFATVERLASALETDQLTPLVKADFRHALNRTLTDIDEVLERIVEVRSDVGARLNALEAQRRINDDVAFQMVSVRSDLQDIDVVQASVDLNLAVNALEAAQQAFVRTQGLSLFNYL